MRRLYKLSVFAMFCVSQLQAQLTTTQTLTPQQLVQNILLGSGVTATNIVYTGQANAIAQYTASASTNLGISSGVVMTSGRAFGTGSFPGNVTLSASTDNFLPGDADLNNIIPATEDACILEFDFVPQGDTLSFNYVFGSDEYPTYVCSSFADVFAYLVSGPDPSGGVYNKINIATIPGTSIPVSINSLNSGSPGSGYQASGCISTAYSNLFVNNQSPANAFIKYNGMSVVLRAKLPVICGQTYHIKMGIADVGDGTLDSGVFLEAGSFSSLPPLGLNTTNANSNVPDSILVEDCNTNCINFIRNGNLALADSFNLQISGNALLGTDYIQAGNPGFVWPNKIVFAPGQDTIKFCNLTAIQDNIPEGVDTIKFTMSSFATGTVSCFASNAINFNLYIYDYTPISIGQTDITLCTGQSTLLNALPSGGYPAYTYTISSPSVNTATLNTGPITGTTVYTITVNDVCNKPATKEVTVTAIPIPTVIPANPNICAGSSGTVSATGATSYTWSTGAVNDSITVSPATTTNYTVIGGAGTCTSSAVATVSVIGQTITISGNGSLCLGNTTTLTASGGSSYLWSTGETTSTIAVSPTTTTTYTVESFVASCTNTAVYTVSVSPVPVPTLAVNNATICSGTIGTVSATGATSYTWSTGVANDSITVAPATTTNYTVTGGVGTCTSSAVATVSVINQTINISGSNLLCFGNSTTLNASGGSSYLWSTNETTPSIFVTPTVTTTYTVASFIGACTFTAAHTVSVTTTPTVVPFGSVVCPNQTTVIYASGANTYTWSTGAISPSITVSSPVTTTYAVTGTLGTTCTNTAVYTLSVVPVPNVSATGTMICSGYSAVLSASGAVNYNWSNSATTQTTLVSPTASTTYTVVGSVGSCTNQAVATVTVISQNVSVIGNNDICTGRSTVLTAIGGSAYTWNTGATTATISVSPTVTTTYTVTSNLLGICFDDAVRTVSVSSNPTIMVTGTSICPGQNGMLTATGATSYSWSTGALTSTINVNPNVNTTYTVTGLTAPSCTSATVYTVNVITTQPIIDPINPVVMCLDTIKAITVDVSSGNPPYSINWYVPINGISPIDTLNNIYYFLENRIPGMAQYTVVATDQCNFKDTILVSIEIIDCAIIIPNVVTANGDGVNDYFRINGLENYPGTNLTVFSRWGNKVYSSTDYKNDWKPEENAGTYFYSLNLADGRKFSGFFQLFTN